METPRTTHRKKTVKLDSYENLMLNVGDLYVDDDQCALQVHEQCLVDTECQIINNTALKVEQTSNKHTKKLSRFAQGKFGYHKDYNNHSVVSLLCNINTFIVLFQRYSLAEHGTKHTVVFSEGTHGGVEQSSAHIKLYILPLAFHLI